MPTKLGHPIVARHASITVNANNEGNIDNINVSINSAIKTDVGFVTENVPGVWLGKEQFPAYPAKLPTFTSWEGLLSYVVGALHSSPAAITALGADIETPAV